jgi:hypothetical protein
LAKSLRSELPHFDEKPNFASDYVGCDKLSSDDKSKGKAKGKCKANGKQPKGKGKAMAKAKGKQPKRRYSADSDNDSGYNSSDGSDYMGWSY